MIEGRDVMKIVMHFLVVACEIIYNYIWERPFFVAFNIVAYTIHIDLSRACWIHETMLNDRSAPTIQRERKVKRVVVPNQNIPYINTTNLMHSKTTMDGEHNL